LREGGGEGGRASPIHFFRRSHGSQSLIHALFPFQFWSCYINDSTHFLHFRFFFPMTKIVFIKYLSSVLSDSGLYTQDAAYARVHLAIIVQF
jgi:hypothetical protein